MKNLKIILIVSTLINVLLLLLIYQGSVQVVALQEWINPSVIATLIGGIGGALAGTWISGNNANKQWKIQNELEINNKKRNYNLIMNGLLFPIIIKESANLLKAYEAYPNMNDIITTYGEKRLDYSEEDTNKITQLFSEVEDDIWGMFEELEFVIKQSEDMAKNGVVDWDTYRDINLNKIYFGTIKEYQKLLEIIKSSQWNKKQLEYLLTQSISDETFENTKKVLEAYYNIVSYKEGLMIAYKNIISLKHSINKKLR